MKRLYRFRSTHALLDGFHELENQEFYFAKMEELNDPMEGYRQYFWNGDKVLWRNLFKHYLLCLYSSYLLAISKDEKYTFSEKDINVHFSENVFSDFNPSFQNLCGRFFQINTINELIKLLEESGSLTEEELTFFLVLIHNECLEQVEYEITQLLDHEIDEPKQNTDNYLTDTIKEWKEMQKHSYNKDSSNFKDFIKTIRALYQSYSLTYYYENSSMRKHKEFFLHHNFVQYYVQAIKKLIYPEVYITCFMENYKNAASWGHYAESHKGVCLIFETDEANEHFTLPININPEEDKSYHPEKLYKINYKSDFVSIDFFPSIGIIPSPQIIEQWYTDPNDAMSIYAKHLIDKKEYDKWHKQHWQEFIPGHTFKLEAWAYEQESRLIINNLFGTEYEDISKRKLKYDFNSLKGIIFGMRTTPQDKLKIISIIKQLCKEYNRKDFEFYQAETSLDSSQIEALPLQIQ